VGCRQGKGAYDPDDSIAAVIWEQLQNGGRGDRSFVADDAIGLPGDRDWERPGAPSMFQVQDQLYWYAPPTAQVRDVKKVVTWTRSG